MFRFATARPVAVFMITAAATFFGILAYGQLGLELMPDLDYPTLTIRTEYPAAAPEEVEQEITRQIESVVGTVESLVGMQSRSRAGGSEVVLEFDWKTDMDRAAQRVRERLARIRPPTGAEPPLLLRRDPSLLPVMSLAVSGTGTLTELRQYAEEVLSPELARLEGVAAVRVLGGLEREVQVRMRPSALAARGLSVQQVVNRLRAANVNVAGGTLKEGTVEFLVRTVAELRTAGALRQVVVFESDLALESDIALDSGTNPNDMALVRLGDVAEVLPTTKEARSMVRVDGRPAVRVDIDRQAGANIVEVCGRVEEAVFGTAEQQIYAKAHPRGSPPPGLGDKKARKQRTQHRQLIDFLAYRSPRAMQVTLLSEQASFIEAALDEVRSAALIGGLLAIFILYVFLRSGYSTLVIAVAIPVSVAVTFVPLLLFGVTLNIMSLGGLALGIGMLVDNSVVVLESIYRCREEGDDIIAAAIRGTQEVGAAVIASTLTTVAVFLPIVFVEGVAGQVFGDLALAVVCSLLASLIVALFVVPMLASRRFDGVSSSVDLPERWGVPMTAMPRWWARRRTVRGLALMLVTLPYVLLQTVLEVVGNAIIVLLGGLLLPLGFIARSVARAAGLILWPLVTLIGALIEGTRRAYGPVLRAALRAPLAVMLIVGMLGWGAWLLSRDLGAELIPEVRQGVLTAELQFPVGTPLTETASRVAIFEAEARKIAGVQGVDAFIGEPDDLSDTSAERGSHTVSVRIRLADADMEPASAAALRRIQRGIPGVEMVLSRPTLFSLRPPIRVEIIGHDLTLLTRLTRKLTPRVAAVEGVTDVRSSMRRGYPELQVRFDRARLAALGLDVRQVAEGLRRQIEGEVATQLRQRIDRVDVRVRVDPQAIKSREALEALIVNPGADVPLPLEAVAAIEPGEGPAEIRHVDGQRAAVITGRTTGFDLGTTAGAVRTELT
ncbi:MAG: HAE1 family hydrophobic/amphiphilic exporter-1, partial [Bradymonadia bacterium]